ncbi:flagellar basal body rod C-terminal domain-containing protein [Phenylobacterium sp.]|jgi:flagellar basal body rod protein FlgC|uniref:flagellar basal body rod C-terminal domain-containing protein n=1 Tax=Phenylobacterium sp. TaxID=1871053 RepID=UPI002F95AE50
MDVLSTARTGLVAAGGRFAASAGRVARAGFDPAVDLSRETVEMIEAKHAFRANVEVVKFADEMWRSLLEIQVRPDDR